METAIVRALNRDGVEFFWTGRAGIHWVSRSRHSAFTGLSLEGARRKASMFNEREPLTGLRFIAIRADAETPL